MPYTLELSPDRDTLLRDRANRLGQTPEEYLRKIVEDRLRPRRSLLTHEEQEAIALLNAELTPDFWRRYSELTEKLRARIITETEHEEIKQFATQEEAWSAKRLALLHPMAQERNLSLLEFMKRNNISHHPDADQFLSASL